MAYNKKIAEGFYSLGSKADSQEDSETDAQLEARLEGKCLGRIFTENHPNLTSVIMMLMDKRKMVLAAQRPLLEYEYWSTGKYNHANLDLIKVSSMMLVGAGYLQQVVVAGLQILYDVGPKSKSGEGFQVDFHMNQKARQTRVFIRFHFNKQPVNLAIEEFPIEGGDSSCVMTLFIED